MTQHLLFIFFFGILLALGAHLVLRSALSLAHKFGIASYVMGFVILGLLTSTPELFVAIQSVISGVPQVSVGNLLGGSILLFSLLLGLSSVGLGKITLNHGLALREMALSAAVIAAPVFILWDGTLSRIDGAFLVGFYFLHTLFIQGGKHSLAGFSRRARSARHIAWYMGQLIVGIIVVAIAARLMVNRVELLASGIGIPDFLLGLFLVSIGTNLPEAALVVTGAMERRRTVAFADILGSAAANTLFLGLLGLVTPFRLMEPAMLRFSLAILAGTIVYFLWTVSSKRDITRYEGIGFLFFYALFLAYEVYGGLSLLP